jgi:NAD(P)H-flavin reductase
MSMALSKMQSGDEVQIKGPLGSFLWSGNGHATWKGQKRKVRQVGMICGGSGRDEPLTVQKTKSYYPYRNYANTTSPTWDLRGRN